MVSYYEAMKKLCTPIGNFTHPGPDSILQCTNSSMKILGWDYGLSIINGGALKKVYEPKSKAMANVSATIKEVTFVLHYHSFMLRHKSSIESHNIHPKQPLYKLMSKYCPLTHKRIVQPKIGKPWLTHRNF